MSECDWTKHKEVDAWVEEYRRKVERKEVAYTDKDDPYEQLRYRQARGDFQGKNKTSVQAYLDEHDRRVYRVSEQARADREERMLEAAETSAAAAQESAKQARASVRWAWASFVTALGALALTAWPYIKERWLQ